MIYQVVWSVPALNRAAGFLRDDPDGLAQVMDPVDDLAADPRPDTSVTLGPEDLRRLGIDRYRVLYEITGDTVTVIHIGRLG